MRKQSLIPLEKQRMRIRHGSIPGTRDTPKRRRQTADETNWIRLAFCKSDV